MSDDFNQLRPPNEDDDADQFDWQSEEPAPESDESDLERLYEDWQRQQAGGTPTEAGEAAPDSAPEPDLPPWMSELADEEPDSGDAVSPTDIPAWLREDAEETYDLPTAQADDLPPWLDSPAAPTEDAEPVTGGDTPPWLAGLELPAEPAPISDDDLLAGLDEALGLAEPPPAAEAAPDWMQSFELPDDEPIESQLPGGLEAYLTEETPDEVPVAEAPEAAVDIPAWLQAAAPTAEPSSEPVEGDLFAGWTASPGGESMPEAAAEPKDIFGELGLPTPETGYDFLDQPATPEEADLPDWFSQEEQPATPGWLDELEAEGTTGAPADADMLAALREMSGQAGTPPAPKGETERGATSFEDLDSLLASYESPAAPIDQGLTHAGIEEIDRMLSDDLEPIVERRAPSAPAPEIVPDTPDWLTDSGVFVGDTSAAAILRKQSERERPLNELDERMRALHERGLELPSPAEEAPSGDLKTLLPGVTQFLPAAPITIGATGIAGELAVTPQQADKIRLLRSLVAAEPAAPAARAPSALDLTYDAPSFADLVGEEREAETLPKEPPPIPAPRPKLDRLLVALLVAASVILPFFVAPLRVANLPPVQFASASRQQAVYDRIDSLAPGDLLLLAAEYGPTGAGELDSLTEVLLRHALLKGAVPVIVSTNPLGLLHAQNILNNLTTDPTFAGQINRPLLPNQDYVIVRYLAGSAVGLRAFSQDVPGLLTTDINGRATNLQSTSLHDFALIVVVAERADELRSWAEQVAPLAGVPLAAAVGQSAAPLSEPYVLRDAPDSQSGIRGLLVGYGDAYTYRAQLDGVPPETSPTPPAPTPPTVPPPAASPEVVASPQPPPTVEPTSEPVSSPQPPPTVEPTSEPVSSPQPSPTVVPTSEPVSSPQPSPTVVPTSRTASSPQPSPTAARTAVTPQATVQTVLPVITGVIDADQAVNVREGPGRTFPPIAAARPGQSVRIIGRNGAGDWLQIRLEDGREGWISATLVRIEEPATTTPDTGALPDPYAVVGLMSDSEVIVFQPTAAPATTAEAPLAATGDSPPAEVTAEAQDVMVAGQPTTYQNERWYGMTLGLMVIITVIAVGTIVNVIGSLFRRQRP